ncbi:MAG: arginase [Methylobacter sp.]
MTILQTLGVVSCLGGPLRTCGFAAEMLRNEFARQPLGELQLEWQTVQPESQGTKTEKLAKLNRVIADFSKRQTEQNRRFLVIGGDHSCALGTWSGVLNGLRPSEELGLIWLDAHMDAHTFDTSPSGNIHGMPLAGLLGRADKKLTAMYPGSRFIQPENLMLLGVRSFEPEEYALLKQTGVDIVFAEQIGRLATALLDAIDRLSRRCAVIGISLDLDFIDPDDAPGVETPAPNGIRAKDLLEALAVVSGHPKILGLEIAEYNPDNDQENKTLRLMKAIVEAFYCPL